MGIFPRQLAIHVLFQALQDVVRPTGCKKDQLNAAKNDAKDFLFGPARALDLRMWCDMAGFQFEAFKKRALEIYENDEDLSKTIEATANFGDETDEIH